MPDPNASKCECRPVDRVVAGLLLLLAGGPALAQDLTPRAYWPAPKGTEVFIAGYGYQSGDVVTDPSLPVVGVDSRIHSGVAAYQRTISLFGRTSNLQFQVPYSSATTQGSLQGQPARRDVQGFADVSATLPVNLLGAPSLEPAEFQRFRTNPRPIVAASITLLAPTGQYDDDRVINLGTNRWATRLRIGTSIRSTTGGSWNSHRAPGFFVTTTNSSVTRASKSPSPRSTSA